MPETLAPKPNTLSLRETALLGELTVAGAENVTHQDVAETANYLGDWMQVQLVRMIHPDFRDKFNQFLTDHTPSLKPGQPTSLLDKSKNFQGHYTQQLKSYDTNLEHVYAAVVYGKAVAVGNGRGPRSLGIGKIGNQPTVFSDAVMKNGDHLNNRQKDIIAAHEAYHGMVDANGSAHEEVKSGFDWEVHDKLVAVSDSVSTNYLRNPDELMARMSQFKNYFGMDGAQVFTSVHLKYLRYNYIKDTDLDNNVSIVLDMVTPKTEQRFIELMNRLPV
jgi:hypothetical protein